MASSSRINSNNDQLRGIAETQQSIVKRNLKEDLAPTVTTPPDAPTVWEAICVKRLLGELPLPLELIESIMDFAEYWPCAFTNLKDSVGVLSDHEVGPMEFESIMFTYHHWVPEAREQSTLLRTEPLGFQAPSWKDRRMSWTKWGPRRTSSRALPSSLASYWPLPARGRRPCRKIVFSIASRQDAKTAARNPPRSWEEVGLFEVAFEKAPATPPASLPLSPHSVTEIFELQDISGSRTHSVPSIKTIKATSSQSRSMHAILTNPVKWRRHSTYDKSPTDDCASNQLAWQTVSKNDCESRLNECQVITWSYDEDKKGANSPQDESVGKGAEFVRSMEVGDSITLRASTRKTDEFHHRKVHFMNYVASANVCIYWAV